MKRLILAMLIPGMMLASNVCAQEEEENSGPYDNEPAYQNNLGATNTESVAADIASESGGANGTKDWEVTIFNDSTGIRVYSGQNKVEVIPTGSDGWVGAWSLSSGQIDFHPSGRPALVCPQQTANPSWFGPCKLPEVAGQ